VAERAAAAGLVTKVEEPRRLLQRRLRRRSRGAEIGAQGSEGNQKKAAKQA